MGSIPQHAPINQVNRTAGFFPHVADGGFILLGGGVLDSFVHSAEDVYSLLASCFSCDGG